MNWGNDIIKRNKFLFNKLIIKYNYGGSVTFQIDFNER